MSRYLGRHVRLLRAVALAHIGCTMTRWPEGDASNTFVRTSRKKIARTLVILNDHHVFDEPPLIQDSPQEKNTERQNQNLLMSIATLLSFKTAATLIKG